MTEEQVQATQVAAERKREAMEEGKVLTWPDLVYAEFLSAVFLTVVLFVVSLVFDAPLEEPSNPNKTPTPVLVCLGISSACRRCSFTLTLGLRAFFCRA